jgi:hypothetical protein
MARDGDELAPVREILETDNLNIHCEADRFKGCPLLDTSITIETNLSVCITWNDREELARELQAVLDKYKI